jgi:hypothetical protein
MSYELAKKIIVPMFNDGQSFDDIAHEMFKAGIKYSEQKRLYNDITIKEGLIVDPNVVRDNIRVYIEGYDLDYTNINDYEQIRPVVEKVLADVEGADERRVHLYLSAQFKKVGKNLPKKPVERKIKLTKLEEEIVDFFADDNERTFDDYINIIKNHVTDKTFSGPIGARWKRHFKMYAALANGKWASDVA